MPSRNEFLELVTEQMAGLGAIASRRMFGGHGISAGIAIITGDKLYFKADADAGRLRGARPATRLQRRRQAVQLRYYGRPPRCSTSRRPCAIGPAGAARLRARKPARQAARCLRRARPQCDASS
jgi:TfoX/Sxy family transcriptional regulator of competence genes